MMRGYGHVLDEVTIDGRPALRKRPRRGVWDVDMRTWDERATLRAIDGRGVPAPRLLGVDADDGALLIERLPGVAVESAWPRATPMPPGAIADLAALLARLAALPLAQLPAVPPGRPTADDAQGFFAFLLRHTAAVVRACPSEWRERLRAIEVEDSSVSALATVGECLRPRALRLCHGDLNRRNLLRHDGRLHVVDWELATLGDPAWDVAVLIHRSGLVAEDVRELHARLRSIHPDPPDEAQVAVYLALERLRSLVVDAVRYGRRGAAGTREERDQLTRRFARKLQEARPHGSWSESEVAALLFGP